MSKVGSRLADEYNFIVGMVLAVSGGTIILEQIDRNDTTWMSVGGIFLIGGIYMFAVEEVRRYRAARHHDEDEDEVL